MNTNTSAYKPRLKEYLTKKGVNIVKEGNILKMNCPTHNDNDPSAIIYETGKNGGTPYVYCPVCGDSAKYDIFEMAGYLSSANTFPEKLKDVQSVLGIITDEYTAPSAKERSSKKNSTATKGDSKSTMTPVSDTLNKKEKIFTQKRFKELGDFSKYGSKITGNWAYRNEKGEIEIVDIRYEGGAKKKNVVSFYYNGKTVKSKGAPVVIYNRHLLSKYPDHTILIVEGAKTAKAAEVLIPFGFLPMTWNGGSSKVNTPDWSCIHGRKVFFFPDDDKPGIKAAEQFFDRNLAHFADLCKIITPYEKARELKNSGADIVEILQLISPEELSKYIMSAPSESPPQPGATGNDQKPPKPKDQNDFDGAPFRILGIAENSQTYFIGRGDRIYFYKLETLTKIKLQILAPVNYWLQTSGTNKLNADDWMFLIDDIIEVASKKDFSIDLIRGCGACRELDGRICFHDGIKTVGDYDEKRVFMRKPKIHIGIGKKHLSKTEIDRMKKAAFNLAFATDSDAMKLLAWSVLAPYAGALKWRPQALLTGPSGSGKSSIENYIIKKLAIPFRMSGGESTAAGYIQARNYDIGATSIDEADMHTEKEKMRREDLLSIMRQSTSDDTPKSYKGTADQSGTTYMIRDMFIFIAISPEIESVANDNRLTKISLKKSKMNKSEWLILEKELQATFIDKNCERLRGMVWDKLETILKIEPEITRKIQASTGKDHRFAVSEGLLMATWLIIWKGYDNPSDEIIDTMIEKNYEMSEPEESRDETEEMINALLEYKVKVYLEKVKEFNVLEVLKIIQSGKMYTGNDQDKDGMEDIGKETKQAFRRSVNNIGIGLSNGMLAIRNKHAEIMKITGKTYGYSKLLKRHPWCVDHQKNVVFVDGSNKKSTVIKDILEESEIPF